MHELTIEASINNYRVVAFQFSTLRSNFILYQPEKGIEVEFYISNFSSF